ncbi:hypothetical protein Tco_1006873 [Tanacetum coccineum]|uniref:Uncharacterized protein n=1 Tax=Tanacetum coccineum TaxID=301880 RepID=A0ABQ5FJ62_9ASTR
MSFGSQSAGDAVVPKFDMHIYPSVLTSDEVNSLVVEYAIPLDLHPCFPPSGFTMNKLPAHKIEIVRHNYVRQLLPTVVQRLLSSGQYRKSLSDVFNLAIAAGWSEGMKAAKSEEEALAFLASAADYDPACKETFMSEFDSLFDKSYPYVEKLAESFRLPLGDPQNMWPEGTRPTLNVTTDQYVIWPLDSFGESCILGNGCHLAIGSWTHLDRLAFRVVGRHLAIGSWTHPEHLAFRVRDVTWPLALGLIWNVLCFGYWASLGHWLLDSSGTSCVPGNGRLLAVGSWTHLECKTFIGIKSSVNIGYLSRSG